ncbi:Uncharacterized membrane protein [Halopenitus malekzadehii]|uniref:Uncharacterized membrane protein n=1 Tax=Halopenitus malekzadehii TaxID=1267564 RepID=A0A1H6JX47_9EURY|nr:EamA family transporter [Halopenitus malekzadehii]SEH65582.1 Uncharacterized membrane protein [Halopenitus malekzadehii]
MAVPSDVLGAGLAVGGALTIATMGLLVRIGTEDGRASDALLVVLGTNLVVLLPLTLVWNYPSYGITPLAVLMFALAGITATLLGRSLFFASVEKIGASRSDAIKASQPLHAAAIAIVILGESLTFQHLLGILFIVVGVAVISLDLKSDGSGSLETRELLMSLLFPLGAAFFYGLEPTVAKIGFNEGTPLLVGLSIKLVVATSGFVAYLYWRGILPGRNDFTRSNLRWYIAAGLANTTFLGFYYGALELSPVNIVIPLTQTSPLFVVVISYVALPRLERITGWIVGGTLCVVTGAVIVVTNV